MGPSAKRIAQQWLRRTGGPVWTPWQEGTPDDAVKYIGVFISARSWTRLLRWFTKVSGEPLLPVRPSDPHMTIKFAPTTRDVAMTPNGALATLDVVGWAADEKGQAVEVVVRDGGNMANKVPHITIANAPGVGAVYSNELLQRGKRGDPGVRYSRARGPSVVGQIQFVSRRR